MAKKMAIALALLMLVFVAWGALLEAGSIRIIIDGQEVTGPLKGAIGAAGFAVGLIALFCAAIILLFAFAGIGIFILAGVIIVGLILAGLMFPFLLVLLVPLAVVWAFIALTRNTDRHPRV